MEMRNDGNILVADNGRGSLCIFRECGVFFEELRLKEIRRPSNIIRQGRTLLVACAGSNSVDRGHLTVYSLCNRILYPEEGDLVWEEETLDMGNRPTGNIITAATHHLPAIESFHLFEKGGSL